MNDRFDVAIVGGSLAGCSLALRLAKAGVRTALIDKASFPRRKPCGEGLSLLACEKLSELDLVNPLSSLEHRAFAGYRAFFKSHIVDLAYSQKAGTNIKGVGIQRFLLDNSLIETAKAQADISLFLRQKVSKLAADEQGCSLQFPGGQLQASFLVLADGVNSTLCARLGIPSRMAGLPRWGISWIFESSTVHEIDKVLVFVEDGFEVYITPVSSVRMNISVLGEKRVMPRLANSLSCLALIQNCLAKIHCKACVVEGPSAIGPLACLRRPASFGRVLLAGDALESLDPIGGMGMTHALISAELASQALISVICEGSTERGAFEHLARQRERVMRPFRGYSRLSALMLRNSPAGGRLLNLASKTSIPERLRKQACREHLGSISLSPAAAMLNFAGM